MNSTLNPNPKKQDREDVHSLGAERDDDSTPENTRRDEELSLGAWGYPESGWCDSRSEHSLIREGTELQVQEHIFWSYLSIPSPWGMLSRGFCAGTMHSAMGSIAGSPLPQAERSPGRWCLYMDTFNFVLDLGEH